MRGRQAVDGQIIQKVKDGDADAFGVLYDEYAKLVFSFVYSQMDSQTDAETITEEIFFRAWKGLPGFDETQQPFLAFLFQVAGSTLAEYERLRRPVPKLDGHATEPNQDFRASIAGLGEEYRSVIIYRFLTGLSPEETALVMRRSVGAVLVLQHRALSALQQKWGG